MTPIALLSAQSIRPLLDFRERIGASRARVPGWLRRGDALLPLAHAGVLWEESALAAGDSGVGLQVGAAASFESAPLGLHVAGSLTVGAGLEAASGAAPLYLTRHRFWLSSRGSEVWLHRRFPDALGRGRRQANDFALQLVLDFLRRGAGPDWRPAELHLEGPPPGHAEALAALAARGARFGSSADTVVFDRSVLALPLPRRAHAAPSSGPSRPAEDFAGSIRQTLRALLELGELDLPSVADAAGTSVRSLQRRLALAGLRFSRLVDEARFDAAARLLRDPAARVVDVSAELGYSDSANFTRAFRRWAGVPPAEFRRSQIQASHAGAR